MSNKKIFGIKIISIVWIILGILLIFTGGILIYSGCFYCRLGGSSANYIFMMLLVISFGILLICASIGILKRKYWARMSLLTSNVFVSLLCLIYILSELSYSNTLKGTLGTIIIPIVILGTNIATFLYLGFNKKVKDFFSINNK